MSFRQNALAFALAVLTGCASSNNYDHKMNPFDEPAQRSLRTANDQASLNVRHALRGTFPAPVQQIHEGVETGAIAIPVASDRALEVTPISDGESPHIQEMIDEATRLGTLGDIHGKVALLEQAGYSGSSKAFYDLARMYLDGTLPSDMSQALKFVTLSHEAGYAEATRVLGMLYLRGQGVPADENYGRLLLEQASKDSPRAAREYGQLLTNQFTPHLNEPELGLKYLRDAAERGDRDAALSLAKELSKRGDVDSAQQYRVSATAMQPNEAVGHSLKDRALLGDTSAMFDYAQQVMLRRIKSAEPEFTAYCWLAVADRLGNKQATLELGLIPGIRVMSEKKNPGRLDQCISDLHYQISGRY